MLGDSRPGQFEPKPSFVGRVKFESSDSRLSVAYSHVNLFMDYVPADSETVSFNGDGGVHFKMNIISLRYNMMKWSFGGEYALRQIVFSNFPSAPDPVNVFIPSFLVNTVGESFYIQSVYRLNKKWNIIARYDVLYADKNDRNGNKLAALVPGLKNYTRFAKDKMLGIQYSISRHWMSRLEFHSVDGTAWLPRQDNPDDASLIREWRMLNTSVSYRF